MGKGNNKGVNVTEADVDAVLQGENREAYDELAALTEQLESLDVENRQLYDEIKAKYEDLQEQLVAAIRAAEGKDRGIVVAIKRQVTTRQRQFEAHFEAFAEEDAAARRAEKQRAKIEALEKQLFEELEANTNIPEDEKTEFRRHYRDLPEFLHLEYLNRLKGNLCNPNPVACLTGFRGTLFELSRSETAISQGLETFGDTSDPIYLTYLGYKKGDDLNRPPVHRIKSNKRNHHKGGKQPESDIQIDVHGIVRDGKPYVYETKSYSRRMLGHEYDEGDVMQIRNQLLKYNEAVEKGKIAGATVEVRGRIDYDFLRWAIGETIEDRGAIPNVEILYTVDLPSGQEYRFVLKGSEVEGLRFENDTQNYTPADKIVIRGIAQAVRDKSISSLIQDVNIDDARIGTEIPQEAVDAPEEIDDLDTYNAYMRLRQESLWRRLKGKALNPPKVDKVPAYDERATPEFVREIIMELQRTLRANPNIGDGDTNTTYLLEDDQIDAVVARAMEEIEKVMEYEVERQIAEMEDPSIHEARIAMGYPRTAPPLGHPLDIEHIVMDTIQDFTKVGEGQRTRSYSDPERFREVRELRAHLEEQDRTYVEIRSYDPLKEKESTTVITGKKAKRKEQLVRDHERSMAFENLRRSEKKLQDLLKRYHKLREIGVDNLDPEEAEEYASIQSQLNNYNAHGGRLRIQLEEKQAELDALNAEKNERIGPLKRAMGQFRQKIAAAVDKGAVERERQDAIREMQEVSAEYKDRITALKIEMLDIYSQIFEREWDSFAIREVGREDANIIKFIYAITPEGIVRVDEERIRGGADSSRAAHSELGQCRNIYAAGEISFVKRDGQWVLVEINNGSGHYRPPHDTLEYAKSVIVQELGLSEDEAAQVQTRNCIFRGIGIDGLAY